MSVCKLQDTALLRSLGLSLAVLLVGACASHGPSHVTDAPKEAVVFPDAARAKLKDGLFVNVETLRLFARGMSKRQLYGLLGTPHFNEGMWGVRDWNYLFNFRSAPNGDYFSCQLQVHFDAEDIAQAGYWKPQACAALLTPPTPAPVAAVPKALPPEPLRLAADALFDFDSATLTAEGRRNVEALALQVRGASEVQTVQVAGYSDRIGADPYNLQLSQRRADAVRDALVQAGVPAAAIIAEGRGETQPLVQCVQRDGEALVQCLAPNRRVEISGRDRLARR